MLFRKVQQGSGILCKGGAGQGSQGKQGKLLGGGDLGGETRWWEATGMASTKALGRDDGVRNRKESRIPSRYE